MSGDKDNTNRSDQTLSESQSVQQQGAQEIPESRARSDALARQMAKVVNANDEEGSTRWAEKTVAMGLLAYRKGDYTDGQPREVDMSGMFRATNEAETGNGSNRNNGNGTTAGTTTDSTNGSERAATGETR